MKIKFLLTLLLGILFFQKNLFCYELAIVTMFKDEANYVKEWIEYHHMIGVDHFVLYNDRSTDNWSEVLEPYIKSNLVQVIEWNAPCKTGRCPGWQVAAFKDGLRRSQGNTKWVALIDMDEFIVPKKNANILDCLNEFYSSAAGVFICWRNFGTGGVYVDSGEPILLKLTDASHPLHSRNCCGKSIVKVDEVSIDKVWYPHHFVLKDGAQYYNGSGRPLFFEGVILHVDPQHTSDIIQINHYVMRDENFYQKERLPKAMSKEYGSLNLLLEHYQSFNYMKDYQVIEFLKTNYPSKYQTYWHGE